jgi:hypothetical protein
MHKYRNMKDLDKKSNNELLTLRKETKDKYEEVRLEVVKVYDYWKYLEVEYNTVNKELSNRGL